MADRRILLLFRELSPPFYGGASIYIHELFSRLPRFRVTVSTNRGPNPHAPETFINGRVIRHRLLGDLSSPFRWGLPRILRLALSVLMMLFWNLRVVLLGLAQRHQLLVLGRADYVIPAAVLLRRLTGAPLVMVLYGEEWYPLQASPTRSWALKRALFDWGMKRTDGVVTLSRRLGARVAKAGYSMPRITVPPGVDADRFRPADQKDELKEQVMPGASLLLLSLSRLVQRKGHDTVIRALNILRDELPGLQLIIGGAGEGKDRLESLVAEFSLSSRVRFVGHIDPDDPRKLTLFQAADIFILPNRPGKEGESEGFGIVYLEAGACGIPVIAGDDGGVIEAVRNGESGIIVDGRSVDETVAAIRRLAGDKALRARLGAGGRTIVERLFRLPNLAVWLEAFFDHLLENSGGGEANR